jgi:hypothetical protein
VLLCMGLFSIFWLGAGPQRPASPRLRRCSLRSLRSERSRAGLPSRSSRSERRLVGPAGLIGSKGIKHLSFSGTVGIPDASACLSQPVVSAADRKRPSFEPLEHSVYFGRQRLGHYARVGKRLYAAYGASGRLLGRFKSRKKAWAAISGAADEGGVSKRRRRSTSVRPTSQIKNAVRKRNGILPSGRGGER